ncbi:UNVERIFIED_CONTAM: hypothetical protein FKN15_076854 [Acipenser sinensis]
MDHGNLCIPMGLMVVKPLDSLLFFGALSRIACVVTSDQTRINPGAEAMEPALTREHLPLHTTTTQETVCSIGLTTTEPFNCKTVLMKALPSRGR